MNNKGSIAIIMLFVILGAILVGGGLGYLSSKHSNTPSSPTTSTSSTTPSATTDLLAPVKLAFDQLASARSNKDLEAIFSKNSLTYITEGQTNWKAMTLLKYVSGTISENGNEAIIKVTGLSTEDEKASNDLYFVLEGGKWKFDFDKTIKTMFETGLSEIKNTPAEPAQGQTVDLAVTDLKPNPKSSNPPSYSGGGMLNEIESSIVNNGTATFSKFEYSYKINDYSVPIATYVGVIKPGQTFTIGISFFEGYSFQAKYHPAYQTGAGNYTFSITLDPDNLLRDTNRSNNTMTKTFYFGP